MSVAAVDLLGERLLVPGVGRQLGRQHEASAVALHDVVGDLRDGARADLESREHECGVPILSRNRSFP